MTLANSFISLSSNGKFSVDQQSNFTFEHYLIFIVAKNKGNV